MKENKINANNYDTFDYDNFYLGFVKMSKPGSKISATNKNKRPKGHQSSIRKGGKR